MKATFYKYLVALTRICGPWLFSLVSRGIAAGYFVFNPRRVRISLHFYKALFPRKTWAYHLWCTWCQFQNFTRVFLDRVRLQDPTGIQYTFAGRKHLQAIMDSGKGGVLLMSHMGSWEIAARLLRQDLAGLRLLLYMGARASQQIEQLQKETVAANGIEVIGVDESDGSPLDIIEGVRFLRRGGIVSMAGDRLWRPGQPAVSTTFLGHHIRLPEAPFALAMASGAPLVVFFALRSNQGGYHFEASQPIYLERADRRNRHAAIQSAADDYARRLEKAVQASPSQWYHFEPFLEAPVAPPDQR